jgi:YVTN family beta-propeller protein
MASIDAGGSTPTPAATPTVDSASATPVGQTNLYSGAGIGMFAPGLASLPPRVYVPDEKTGDVIVIDPASRKIIGRMHAGSSPEHINPAWDLQQLFVDATYSNQLVPIDIHTGKLGSPINVPGPYNLYFSLDGTKAIDVRDSSSAPTDQLYFYDRQTWSQLKALTINRAGANHADMSPDGSYMLLSCEYSGYVIKIDVNRMVVLGEVKVGGSPTDVRLSPDGSVFYVANQIRNGVSVIDPDAMKEIAFIPTGLGAHGMALSRDATQLYVTNRIAGSLSTIDFATRKVVSTVAIGASPDMIAVSADGKQLWISNRYDGSVSLVDATSKKVLDVINTGGHPHGLAYFPEPGSLSLGHNGIYR